MKTLPLKFAARLPTVWGEFKIFSVPSGKTGNPHVVLVNNAFPKKNKTPLVRVHSECLTGDIFGSRRCDCGEQLRRSLKLIGKNGGALIYLRQEGRGVGLANKLKAYRLQDRGLDTVEAQIRLHLPVDSRRYDSAAAILKYLGITKLRLLTNNPHKIDSLAKAGIKVAERLPVRARPNKHNRRYLETKQTALGHLLNLRLHAPRR